MYLTYYCDILNYNEPKTERKID